MNNGLQLLFSFDKSLKPKNKELISIPLKNGKLYFNAPGCYTDNENNLSIYIKGRIFIDNIDPIQFIKTEYLNKGIDFIKDLKGSFLIIIIDSFRNKFYVFTDKLNSKKFFIQKTSEFILITDNIFSQIIKTISVDKSSLAQYLTSGFVFNSRTLIQGIDLSKPSTIYSFSGGGILENKYWEINFSEENSKVEQEELKEELFLLLQNSVKKRVNNKDALLSLSGGYDATCLQLLMNEHSTKEISCFSYYANKLVPFSDAWVAKKQATLLENKIEFISAYDGNFENFITQNAINGQGISNISFETNVWDYLQNKYPGKSIFVGEEFFGMRDENTTDFQEILTHQNFLNWDNIKNPEKYFRREFIQSSSRVLDLDRKQISNTILEKENSSFDNQMLLYYNYRLPNVLLSWREFFTGRNNPVEMPLLDDEIISFVTKLPYWARNNKFLFKETLKSNYPNIFKNIPRATKSNNFNWREILKDQTEIIEKINSENSSLDKYISPSAVTTLLNEKSLNSDKFYKFIKRVNRKIKIPITLKSNYRVPNYLLVLRILVLKRFLSEFEKAQKTSEFI